MSAVEAVIFDGRWRPVAQAVGGLFMVARSWRTPAGVPAQEPLSCDYDAFTLAEAVAVAARMNRVAS